MPDMNIIALTVRLEKCFTNIFPIIKSRCYCAATAVERPKKPARKPHSRKSFIDKVRMTVRGGSGGMGAPSVGGIGGNGGNAFIKCVQGASLSQYKLLQHRRIVAGHGFHHKRTSLKIRHGQDIYITVPPGTEIQDQNNVLICDMNHHNHVIKIAKGGVGGSSKTAGFNGVRGEKKYIILELKTIADAALTGFPNAGKSSLLRAISRAIPKVASYPFTTVNPMVGSIFYSDNSQIKVADLPGLIEDAHLNKGMGHRFLRHIERTRMVLLVIDINGFQLKAEWPYRSPLETIILLLKELALYQELILSRPFLLVFNKMDCEGAERMYDQVLNEIQVVDSSHYLLNDSEHADVICKQLKQFSEDNFSNVFKVSALTHDGIDVLKDSLHHVLNNNYEN